MGDLFGGGGGAGDTQVITPPAPQIPNMPEMNSAAYARLMSARPWLYGPYRAADYFQNVQATPNMQPQFHQMMGQGGGGQMMGGIGGGMQMGGAGGWAPPGMGGAQGGMPGMMGDFSQMNPMISQAQTNPLAWALGQMFSQIMPQLYQGAMGNGQPGQQQVPGQQPQQGQPQQQSGQNNQGQQQPQQQQGGSK